MTPRTIRRLAIACFCALAAASLTACGKGGSEPAASPTLSADAEKFEQDPTLDRWDVLYRDVLAGSMAQADLSRTVQALTSRDVPRTVLNVAAIDLSGVNYPTTIKWIHQFNLSTRGDTSPAAVQLAKRTASFAWIMLALRSSYATDYVDLSHADLRDGDKFVGQSMNLNSVDFSGALLPGGAWRNVNLTNANFTGTQVQGALYCVNCTWGTFRDPDTAAFTDVGWMPSKPKS